MCLGSILSTCPNTRSGLSHAKLQRNKKPALPVFYCLEFRNKPGALNCRRLFFSMLNMMHGALRVRD